MAYLIQGKQRFFKKAISSAANWKKRKKKLFIKKSSKQPFIYLTNIYCSPFFRLPCHLLQPLLHCIGGCIMPCIGGILLPLASGGFQLERFTGDLQVGRKWNVAYRGWALVFSQRSLLLSGSPLCRVPFWELLPPLVLRTPRSKNTHLLLASEHVIIPFWFP